MKQGWQGQTTHTTDTTDNAMKAAGGAGQIIMLTDILITNTSATFTQIIIKSGSTEIGRVPVPPTGGVTHRFATPLETTANAALNFAAANSLTSIFCTATGLVVTSV